MTETVAIPAQCPVYYNYSNYNVIGYYAKTGWWRYTLEGMNAGMKTHYQNNSNDPNDILKKEYKQQLLKDRDFRRDFSRTMKDDIWLSKLDRFELQVYRFSLPFTNPLNYIKTSQALQLKPSVEPVVPTPSIHINWEVPGLH